MIREVAALPMLWGGVLAEVVDKSTPISLGLFVVGISGTAALVWWAAHERQRTATHFRDLKDQIGGLNDRVVELEAKE